MAIIDILSKRKVADTELLKGATDWHCHILPGVDDGFRTMEDSLAVLDEYEKAGFASVWLTPHIMEDIPNTPEFLKSKFEELQAAYQGKVQLNLAAENMMDTLFEERLDKNELLPLCADRLLVETSYFNPPLDLKGIIYKIKLNGYIPVLAHPERYIYMNMNHYKALKEMDVIFQLNLSSLSGNYGPDAKLKAEKMLKMGYYSLWGTDLHRRSSFTNLVEHKTSKNILELLLAIK